nr:hypothetical protein [Alicyclobacillus acidiphilus]
MEAITVVTIMTMITITTIMLIILNIMMRKTITDFITTSTMAHRLSSLSVPLAVERTAPPTTFVHIVARI